jgi:hypothetical protein
MFEYPVSLLSYLRHNCPLLPVRSFFVSLPLHRLFSFDFSYYPQLFRSDLISNHLFGIGSLESLSVEDLGWFSVLPVKVYFLCIVNLSPACSCSCSQKQTRRRDRQSIINLPHKLKPNLIVPFVHLVFFSFQW